MDKITLQDRRDFPLTTNSLAFMQAAYAALEKLGYIGGDNYIVSGCTVTGSSAAPGYVFLKGILMPFIGGSITTTVQIVKVTSQINVDAGVREQTSYRAEFGVSSDPANNVAWADIVRTDTIISLMSQMSALNNRLTDTESDILVNAQDIQGNTDEITTLRNSVNNLEEVVYVARIDTAGTNKISINSMGGSAFINAVTYTAGAHRFTLQTADADFKTKYFVEAFSNGTSSGSNYILTSIVQISNSQFEVVFRHSGWDSMQVPFWIKIFKMK